MRLLERCAEKMSDKLYDGQPDTLLQQCFGTLESDHAHAGHDCGPDLPGYDVQGSTAVVSGAEGDHAMDVIS